MMPSSEIEKSSIERTHNSRGKKDADVVKPPKHHELPSMHRSLKFKIIQTPCNASETNHSPIFYVNAAATRPIAQSVSIALESHTNDPITLKLNASPDSCASFLPNRSAKADVCDEKLPFVTFPSAILVCDACSQRHSVQ